MARGFKSGGRKAGSRNKRTAELEAAVKSTAEMVASALGIDTFDGDAHAFLMLVYKNSAMPIDLRIDAAKAALRFEKPALASHEVRSESVVRYVARVPDKATSPDTWQQQHEPKPQTIQ